MSRRLGACHGDTARSDGERCGKRGYRFQRPRLRLPHITVECHRVVNEQEDSTCAYS